MPTQPDPLDVAAALFLSIALFLRQLRRSPVQDELTPPEISALERLDRAGSATPRRPPPAPQHTPPGPAGSPRPSRSPRRPWGRRWPSSPDGAWPNAARTQPTAAGS